MTTAARRQGYTTPLLLAALLAAAASVRAQQPEVIELLELVWDRGVEAALERYDGLAADRRDPALLVRLADQLLWTGKDLEATQVLARAEAEAPWLAELRFQQGRALLHRGRGETALAVFQEGLARLDADPTLSDSERRSLAVRLRNRVGLLARADDLVLRSGAYRRPDGSIVTFKFDPYLHTFPATVDLASGTTRVLYPSETGDLEWRDVDGRRSGTVTFEDGGGSTATMVIQDSTGEQRAASLAITQEALRFSANGASLEGTLFRPATAAAVPAVVLVHGAGLSTRYNLVHEAIAFAAAGVAAFVYDKPGLGASTGGNWLLLSIPRQASYASAAIDLLRRRGDIKDVGIWGFSQGGWVAPLVAHRSANVDFIILVSSAAVTPQEQSVQASIQRLRASGFAERDIDEAAAYLRDVWARVNTGTDMDGLAELQNRAGERAWAPHVQQPRIAFELDWWRENEVDARAALEALAVPALIVFGEWDDAVPPGENTPLLARYLAAAPTGDFTIVMLPGADHQLMVGGDYHPLYLATVTAWLTSRFPARP